MSEFIIITTAFKNDQISKRKIDLICEILLSEKLAACMQKNLVSSKFIYQNEVNDCREILLNIKTRKIHFDKIAQIIKENHPYQIPEIISTSIINSSQEYFSWLDANISK
jgi:periplasmic divalent cation tolerance protein